MFTPDFFLIMLSLPLFQLSLCITLRHVPINSQPGFTSCAWPRYGRRKLRHGHILPTSNYTLLPKGNQYLRVHWVSSCYTIMQLLLLRGLSSYFSDFFTILIFL
uniref:Secreted protein n=1 Tax=Cacopsylla melanoneura TaxID=428564 RepID=A0A8D8LJ84_9HEMI